jgi:hypothetical protein
VNIPTKRRNGTFPPEKSYIKKKRKLFPFTGDHTTVLGNGAECSSGNPHTTTICEPGRTIVVP